MEFMTGIIGFYFLTQGVPASLLLISTPIATTSLSKTLGHSWASLLSHVNVNGTEIEKKVCPETFYVGNNKTDAKSRCSVTSQLPCTILAGTRHQHPMLRPQWEGMEEPNNLCSASRTGPSQPEKNRVCLKCLICTDCGSCWRQVIVLYFHMAEFLQLQEAVGEHSQFSSVSWVTTQWLKYHQKAVNSGKLLTNFYFLYFFLIISLSFFYLSYFLILMISGLSFQVILNQTQGFP